MADPEHGKPHRNHAVLAGCLAGTLAVGVAIAACVAPETAPGTLPTTEQHSTTATPAPTTEQCIDKLPVSFLAGQVLMIGLRASDMADQASLFKQYDVGGAVLMTAPADPGDNSIQAFKEAGGSKGDPVLVSTDEEGGTVQRFRSLGVLPAPQDVANSLTPAEAQNLIAGHGAKLKAAGIDIILGPLADVAPVQGASALGDRVFSSDPQVVSQYVAAYVRGWQTAGLLPVIKHFPGMGSASANTDNAPATTPPLSLLKQRDFVPYRPLAGSGTTVMVGNQTVPGWFEGPASLSPIVTSYLRGTLGYANSLIMTDSLSAAAVTHTTTEAQAVVKAIAAGNDMPLVVGESTDLASNTALIDQLASSLEQAVANGTISKHQLAIAVGHKLTAQHVNACSLTP